MENVVDKTIVFRGDVATPLVKGYSVADGMIIHEDTGHLCPDISVDELHFGTRGEHFMRAKGITMLSELLCLTREELLEVPNLGQGTVSAIARKAEMYLSSIPSASTQIRKKKMPFALMMSAAKNVPIEDLLLSTRSYNCLKRNGMNLLSDLVGKTKDDLMCLRNMGHLSADEILLRTEEMIKKIEAEYKAEENTSETEGNKTSLQNKQNELLELLSSAEQELRDKQMPQMIVSLHLLRRKVRAATSLEELPYFASLPDVLETEEMQDFFLNRLKNIVRNDFFGKSPETLRDKLPASLREETFRKLLGDLSICGTITCSDDGRFYPQFRSCMEAIDEQMDSRNAIVLRQRIEGRTLDAIAADIGVTRERVRQLESKALQQLTDNGELFAEDQYRYLFEQYQVDAGVFADYLDDDPCVYRYLLLRYKRGAEDILQAIKDDNVLPDIQMKILEFFLNRQSPEVERAAKRQQQEKKERNTKQREEQKKALKKQGNGSFREPKFREMQAISKSELSEKTFRRLTGRVKKEFDKKFYLGDIVISDEEYELLLAYSSVVCKSMAEHKYVLQDCPLLALTLVQIGIRKYSDKKFWPHCAQELGIEIPAQNQMLLGTTFINTLKAHNKYIVSETERVASILFHTFVSNYYSRGLFELLFSYYNNDLERDINRNDAEQMRSLMDTLASTAEMSEEDGEAFTDQFMVKGARAYKLRQHTLQAISVNYAHSNMRLRRLLRLIDKAFWRDETPKNPRSRLTILFKEWKEESKSFEAEYKRYISGEIRNRGKKHFSSPYLFADYQNGTFYLNLPGQLVKRELGENLIWNIRTSERQFSLDAEAYPVVTGCKTEEKECGLLPEELLGSIECELRNDLGLSKKFQIHSETVRFFDADGDYAPRLFKGQMSAYALPDQTMKSNALVDQISLGGLTRWDFDLEDGDVVVLPDGCGMTVGERFVEGLAPRGKVPGAVVFDAEAGMLPVFRNAPALLLTIPKNKINGTCIMVNGKKHQLSECEYTDFEMRDSRGVRAFWLPTEQFAECKDCAVNHLIVDVPSSKAAKFYDFVLVEHLEISFDGQPYVFAERGTVLFPERFTVSCADPGVSKIGGENGFLFELSGDLPQLHITINQTVTVCVDIPMLLWSEDAVSWHATPMGDIWHTVFFSIRQMYFRFPEGGIYLGTNTEAADDDDEDEQRTVQASKRADGSYLVDMTRFKSWLTRDRIKHEVFVKLGRQAYPFASVFTLSFVPAADISADYETGELSCTFEIIGQSTYYVDIIHIATGTVIAEKAKITDGHFSVKDRLRNGKYSVELFETDEDDFGFDEITYYSILKQEKTLINKYDISGKHLHVLRFKHIGATNLFHAFSKDYWVTETEKSAPNEYTGRLLADGIDIELPVKVLFESADNLRYFQMQFWEPEEEAYLDFLFDNQQKELLEDEPQDTGLRGSEKYRRFIELHEGYQYYGSLEDYLPVQSVQGETENVLPQSASMPMKDLGLTVRQFNHLNSAGIKTVGQFFAIPRQQLPQHLTLREDEIDDLFEKIKRLS